MKTAMSLLAVICASLPASAAVAGPSAAGTRTQLHSYYRCLVSAEKPLVRKIVLGDRGAFSEMPTRGRLFRPSCVKDGKNATFQGLSYLNPMAEYILATDYKSSTAIVWNEGAEAVRAEMLVNLEAARNEQQKEKGMRDLMGYCLLEKAPINAGKLLQSRIESDAEQQIVQDLASDVQVCLDAKHSSRLTVDDLRGAIATARYRILYRAQRGGNDA